MNFKYIKRVFQEPDDSYFLFGPRGTGKSTMTENNHPHALFIDLRLATMRYRLIANPDELTELVNALQKKATIVIDEIQKVPELLPIIHMLIEANRGWQFILTGSSARKLKRQGVDLLGGRALKKILHPFMACELGDNFDISDSLRYGLLPLRFGKKNPTETLRAYISLYIEEEVKAEGLIRNYEGFARFLQVMAFSHGTTMNITNIARECFVKRTTVHDWISILEDLLIGYQLFVFTQKAKRELSAHPKFYFFDVGVFRYMRPFSIKDNLQEVEGIALEGMVLQHLVAWRDYTSEKHEVHFWRTRSGVEVDFIVSGPLGLWAIEVKNTKNIRGADLSGLRAFSEDFPNAKGILLYRGKEKLVKNGMICFPCDEFLKTIVPNRPLL